MCVKDNLYILKLKLLSENNMVRINWSAPYVENIALFFLLVAIISCSEGKDNIEVEYHTHVCMVADNFLNEEIPTRSTIIPESSGCSFSWNYNDVVGVYSQQNGLTNFIIDESSISSDGLSAGFNGAGFLLLPNSLYHAFYPYSKAELNKKKIHLSYNGQRMISNGDFKSLGDFDFMYANGVSDENNHASFTFKHIGCVVELKIKVPTTAMWKEIRFELENPSSGNYLIKSGVVDLTEDLPAILPDSYSSDSIMILRLGEDGIGVRQDDILTAYMMLPPQNLEGEKVCIKLVDNNKTWYKTTVWGKNMRAGYTYHYAANTENEGFEAIGQGFPDDNVELEYVSTFIHNNPSSYQWFQVENDFLYATGPFGVRKISYKNELSPCLITESDIELSKNQIGRSMVMDGNLLYVGIRQATAGKTELYKPELSFSFDTNLQQCTPNSPLSNNSVLNSVVKKIQLKSVALSDVDEIHIYKAHWDGNIYKNVIQLRKNGGFVTNLCRDAFNSKAEAEAALSDNYENEDGDKVELDWSKVTQSYTQYKNVVLYTFGEFDHFEARGSATFDETAKGSPIRGGFAGRFKTTSTADNSAKVVYDKEIEGGEISFMMNLVNQPNRKVDVPLFRKNYINKLWLSLIPNSGGFSFSLSIGGRQYTDMRVFNIDEWYNVKVSVVSDKVSLCIRGKECGYWINLITANISGDIFFDAICFGIVTEANNVELLVDDLYYNSENIDQVTYVEGALAIVNKNTLSVINKFNLNYKVCGVSKIKNRLILNFLAGGFNVYDTTIPEEPQLIYTYRPDSWVEYQGVDCFEANGRLYAICSSYVKGFSVIDLTESENIRIVSQIGFNQLANYNPIADHCYSFDVVADYPYAYATFSHPGPYINTSEDHRGVLVIGLDNLSNPMLSLTEIPKEKRSSLIWGDRAPTRITKCGKHIIINSHERGICVFDIGVSGQLTFNNNFSVPMPNECSCNAVIATEDGRLFVGDDATNGTLRNIYLFKGLK